MIMKTGIMIILIAGIMLVQIAYSWQPYVAGYADVSTYYKLIILLLTVRRINNQNLSSH